VNMSPTSFNAFAYSSLLFLSTIRFTWILPSPACPKLTILIPVMVSLRRSVMSSRLLRRKGFTGAGQSEGIVGVREGNHGRGPAGEWSLSSHSPGQEPWSVEFEELVRLRREAGDADGLDGELTS
jgi:hypothetical protein